MNKLLLLLLSALLLTGCAGGRSSDSDPLSGGDTLTQAAEALRLIEFDGWTLAEITTPWDSAAPPQRIAMVDRDAPLPKLPEDVTVVRVPLERAIVTTTVVGAAIDRLGKADAIGGVTDAPFFRTPAITRGITDKRIADCGTTSSPVVEKIIDVNPDAFLATPYADSDHSAIAKMKIPVVEMADYIETTPQGRAEWLRFIGRLFGKGELADSLYNASMAEYSRLAALTAEAPVKPKVITEKLTSGVWYVPGGRSYMARLIADAGATYPFADNESTGSIALDFAAVYDRGADADYWILKSYGENLTLADIVADNPLYAKIKAVSTGGVYSADTAESPLFEEFPFRPELLLADYILIFHPELAEKLPPARYFHKVD